MQAPKDCSLPLVFMSEGFLGAYQTAFLNFKCVSVSRGWDFLLFQPLCPLPIFSVVLATHTHQLGFVEILSFGISPIGFSPLPRHSQHKAHAISHLFLGGGVYVLWCEKYGT